jgi:Ca-activated chloride channel family protein
MRFLNPQILFLILCLPLWFLFFTRHRRAAYFRFPSISVIKVAKKKRFFGRWVLVFLRVAAVVLVIIALARPQAVFEKERSTSEGIDIVLALDVSTSMLAEDFTFGGQRQNRLYVVKRVVEDFIKARHNDRIGMIAFAGRPYTVCPLTLDYDWLINNLQRVNIGMVEDGTAIGSAIATGLNRLRQSPASAGSRVREKAKSRVLILLTDGRNNAGNISPQTAASAAKALAVKIYTIGAGTKGLAPYPVRDFFANTVYQPIRIDIDDEGLSEVARITGGEYFRATDTNSLKQIYANIDRMEKTPVEEAGFTEYRELFWMFLLAAFGILFGEAVLSQTVLRRIP